MRDELEQVVRPSADLEIQAPAPIDPGLPDSLPGIDDLGPEGGMADILDQEGEGLLHARFDLGRGFRIAPLEVLRPSDPHGLAVQFLDQIVHILKLLDLARRDLLEGLCDGLLPLL